MNNIVPIAQIAAYKNGDALTAVSGMLENVWERKTGTIKEGPQKGNPWTIQNLFIKDQTGRIKVTLFGRKECPKSMEGMQVTFSAVTVDDNTYNGKTTRTVKVTENSGVKVIMDNGEKSNPVAPSAEPRAGSGTMVPGVKVGMALNNAGRDLISRNPDLQYLFTSEFEDDLFQVASKYIRVSDALEAGRQLEAPKTQPDPASDQDMKHRHSYPGDPLDSSRKPEPEQVGPPDDNFLQEGDEIPF